MSDFARRRCRRRAGRLGSSEQSIQALLLPTARQLERADARVPFIGAGLLLILSRIPERTVVIRINRQRAVVTPAANRVTLLTPTRIENGISIVIGHRAVAGTVWQFTSLRSATGFKHSFRTKLP